MLVLSPARGGFCGATFSWVCRGSVFVARLARVVGAEIPHHITQRGNAGRFILEEEQDRSVYLEMLQRSSELYNVALIGYCLMSNHIHLVAVPAKPDGLARTLKETHGRFASYWNAVHHSSGHVWQGRYYSCPLDESHLWRALRYTELNPVRARMVARADDWKWSSATTHCQGSAPDSWLAMNPWRERWSSDTWRAYLEAGVDEEELSALRRSTFSGRPLGSMEFTQSLEKVTKRRLVPQKRGPQMRSEKENKQQTFSFGGQ